MRRSIQLQSVIRLSSIQDERPSEIEPAQNDERTTSALLGGCDAFVSHSWSDEAHPKFERLESWASTFTKKHGRTPLLWIDKFSIDQSNITTGLASLPVNLAGCSQLVCLLGPTYLKRLWCLIELHTFAQMGIDTSHLTVLPVSDNVDEQGMIAEAQDRVKAFSLRQASCYNPAERTHLLDVIASGCGSYDAFERMVRSHLSLELTGPGTGTGSVLTKCSSGRSSRTSLRSSLTSLRV